MPASKIKANYDQLDRIAGRFGREADATCATISSLRQTMAALEEGDWTGPAARAFYAEMREDVLPSLRRLAEALAEAQRSTVNVLAIARQAEADAARVLGRLPDRLAADGPPAPPPRIYIVNGINNRRSDDPADRMDPTDSMVKLRDYLVRRGYDPDQVIVAAPVFNTNLQGVHAALPRLGPGSGGPVDAYARTLVTSVSTLTGAAAGVANTLIGAGQVTQEYVTGGASQTRRVDAFIRDDLARNPLLPNQGVVLLGHSGGGVVVSNLAGRLEAADAARRDGGSSPLDVQGVVTLGAPLVNFDAASQVAPVVMLRHSDDLFGLPYVRSDEARTEMARTLITFASGPARLGALGAFVGFDHYARDPGASKVVSLNYDTAGASAHRSYWQESSTVFTAIFEGLGVAAR